MKGESCRNYLKGPLEDDARVKGMDEGEK
jgi:hypothetical protein